MAERVKRRRYDSSRRRQQAVETRRAILRAAAELFLDQGYARTTIADIATAAGVSAETIYGAFGTKATVLHNVWDVTIGGDDDEIMFHERPEVVATRNEPDLTTRLQMWARLATVTQRRTAPFMLMLRGAAGAEPAAIDMLAEIGRQRLVGMEVMAADAAKTGQLAVSVEECRDFAWATTDGTLWHLLVNDRAWPEDVFAEWLGRLWISVFVGTAPRGNRWEPA